MDRKNVIIIACSVVLVIAICVCVVFLGKTKQPKIVQAQQSTEQGANLIKADENVQKKYEILDVKVEKSSGTKVFGNIKSNEEVKKTVQVVVKFYKEDGKVALTSQAIINDLEPGQTKPFEINVLGDYSNYKYVVEVEFTD